MDVFDFWLLVSLGYTPKLKAWMVGVVLRFAVIHGSFSPIDVLLVWTSMDQSLHPVSHVSSPEQVFFQHKFTLKTVFDFLEIGSWEAIALIRSNLNRSRPKLYLGGGCKYFLFSPLLGEMIRFVWYFSNGLKPPTRYHLWTCEHKKHLPKTTVGIHARQHWWSTRATGCPPGCGAIHHWQCGALGRPVDKKELVTF